MRTVLVLLVVIGLAAGGGAYYFRYMSADQAVNFRTAIVKRGDLQPTISATGTLEPEEVVDVGAQVAGRIVKFGLDQSDPEGKKPVDYRSAVKKDQLLAEIDPIMYRAQRDQAQASLESAKANLLLCKAKRDQAEKDWNRAQGLRPAKAIADTDYDLAEANYRTAEASVAVGEATIKQDEAALEMAEANLDYTTIPVAGRRSDRRPPRQYRPDRGLQLERIQLVPDRQRLEADAGVGGRSTRPTSAASTRTCPCGSPSTPIRATSSGARCCKSA